MLGRTYSIALVAIYIEAAVNGLDELSYMNPWVFFPLLASTAILVATILISQWFFSGTDRWLKLLAIWTLILLVSWPLQLADPSNFPTESQPWIWWLLGVSCLAAGASFRALIAILYLLAVPIYWFFLSTSEFAGSTPAIDAGQNSLHVFIFASILSAMVLALRWEAAKVDSANQEAISSAVESARVEAIELERSRMDALVHDSVLTTLLLAARAETETEKAAASKSAKDAIAKLQRVGSANEGAAKMTLASFFEALQTELEDHSTELLVSADRISDLPIPSDVAAALSEATLQAVDNSLKHAGKGAKRVVRLRGQSAGLKIVISDDGRGFRPSQVSKDRLGLRTSIIGRVEKVGGRVFIDSAPGSGSNIVIEWGLGD